MLHAVLPPGAYLKQIIRSVWGVSLQPAACRVDVGIMLNGKPHPALPHQAGCMVIAFQAAVCLTANGAMCQIPPGHMELGLGIHGEPGARRQPLCCADEAAAQVLPP